MFNYFLCTGYLDQRGRWEFSLGIVLEKFSENESVGDVWEKCPDTVPEWHNRNLVTLTNKGIENNNKTAKHFNVSI